MGVSLAKTMVVGPKLCPSFSRRPAHKNIRMVFALFVFDALGIAVMPGQAAGGKFLVRAVAGKAQNDQRRRRWTRVSAQPRRIRHADRGGQMIRLAEDFDGALLAVVS